jgi:hypothetical protein
MRRRGEDRGIILQCSAVYCLKQIVVLIHLAAVRAEPRSKTGLTKRVKSTRYVEYRDGPAGRIGWAAEI